MVKSEDVSPFICFKEAEDLLIEGGRQVFFDDRIQEQVVFSGG